MTAQQLKEYISELVVFLNAIDALLPNKIDRELLDWLVSIEGQPWTCDLLVKAMSQKGGR